MIKTNLTLIAIAVLFMPACAHRSRVSHAGEPLDPTGNDPVFARAAEKDALDELLKETVLHYGYDEATLNTHDMVTLRRLADQLEAHPWAAVRIAGHCDERGTEEYNLALGQRRADAARSYLLALGVSPGAVETITFGEELPLIDAQTDEAYAENRRAEFGAQPLELFGLVTEQK
jgi:peptidoglycan-associated lipoprotein